MDFNSKHDIEAPIAEVFEALCDFESFERSAFRRGVEVQRLGDIDAPGKGLAWDAKFTFRGKARELRITLSSYEPVTRLVLNGESNALKGQTEIDLVALSPNRTRLSVALSVSAKTLSGRLLIQSFKLARGSMERKFNARIADFASMTEEKLTRQV